MNEDFSNRGKRLDEQVEVMRQLWAEPHVTFDGDYHEIDDAGINPMPPTRSIPLWFGGHEDRMLRRTARLGDGWIMLAFPPDDSALEAFQKFRGYVREAGRDPSDVGLEVWTTTDHPTIASPSAEPKRTSQPWSTTANWSPICCRG